MDNVKKTLPRRKLAIRRWMIAVIMLLLLVLLSPRRFTVEQNLRYFEKQRMTGETEVVYKYTQSSSYLKDNRAFTFSRNKGTLIFLEHYYDRFHGWRTNSNYVFDLTDNRSLWEFGQASIVFKTANEGVKFIFYGSIRDNSISSLCITGRYLTVNPQLYKDLSTEELYKEYAVDYEIIVDDFSYSNTGRWFCVEYNNDKAPGVWNVGVATVIAYDEDGNEMFYENPNSMVVSI